MRTLIKVTKEDIANGCPESTNNCPIARAILRQVKTDWVSVGYCIKVVDQDAQHLKYKCPRSAKRFINRFDNGEPVKPFNFYLEKV